MCEHGLVGACAVCDGAGQQPETVFCQKCNSPLPETGGCDICLPSERRGPPPRSWAETAMLMAAGDDSGFDWDAWKDQMKEQDL